MSNRVYDSSQLTKRRAEKAIASSFLTRMSPPNNLQGSPPILGIKDSSIMNAVKTGHMTEYTRYPTCVGVSAGCPCNPPPLSIIPGTVTNITFTVGSIIVSWNPPTIGTAPFIYLVTPYLNGVAQSAITTSETTYRFTNLTEGLPYTFTVCAMNSIGSGTAVPSPSYFIAPPSSLSNIMAGSTSPVNIDAALKYVINAGLDSVLSYVQSVNLGPTKGSRYIYVWISSVVQAWNWVRAESRIRGIHDQWDWTNGKVAVPLSDNDSILWICSVIDYVTPFFIPIGYQSIYNCSADIVARVKEAGDWNNWSQHWQNWYSYRQNDGSVSAATALPTLSANWNNTIVVDGTTVNNISGFPAPQGWTRLTVQGKKQGYMTYLWDSVLSTCLSESDEQTIQDSVAPVTGAARDTEINTVKDITAALTDAQKISAEFWAGGPTTVSPPLMFIWFWKEYMRTVAVSCPNLMFSLLDLGIHLFEGGRITWRIKSAYMQDRPIQEIRRRFTGSAIQSWNGTVAGAQWIPYQAANFVTPPFADFPSGHSHFSKAFALTMTKWFGATIAKNQTFYDKETLICPLFTTNQTALYGDFPVTVGASEIQPGAVPAAPLTLSFGTWDAMADGAGMSRLYGGIHCISAHTASQTTAVEADGYINSAWNIQTA